MKRSGFAFTALFFSILFLFSSCHLVPPGKNDTVESSASEIITNAYGTPIPVYSDVSSGKIDPKNFSKDENGRMQYTAPGVNTCTGIDVSQYQGTIDWQAVKNDGIDFVMLRVGCRGYGPSGYLMEDDAFELNYTGAANAGLKVGVYFFSQAINESEAVEEANYVLDKVKGKTLSCPIAFDWERIGYDTARTDGVTPEQVTALTLAFIKTVQQAGYEPLIYFNTDLGYFGLDLSKLNAYHFWVAEYRDTPTFYYDYTVWQYTTEGRVNGINADVDLNIYITPSAEANAVG